MRDENEREEERDRGHVQPFVHMRSLFEILFACSHCVVTFLSFRLRLDISLQS